MKRIGLDSENDLWRFLLRFPGLLVLLLGALPATAKMAIDFDPHLDFSKFKTFAYIGGVEQHIKLQLDPDMFNIRIHGAVARELLAKGLREVKPEENPDLVVRYWIETQTEAYVTGSSNWGTYGFYGGYHWTVMYFTMSTHAKHQGILGIELINARTSDLAWRMLATEKIIHADPNKNWKTADGNIKSAFKGFPPSSEAIEAKRKEWAKEDAARKSSQP